MRLNPVVEESLNLYFRAREFRLLHMIYLGVLTVATILLWPTRGLMEYFRSQSVPGAFLALAVLQVIGISGISIYVGLDRLASSQIIRYSEWLERTTIAVRTLLAGKFASALIHAVFLTAITSPLLFIAAGPAGIPVRAVLSVQWITFLVGMFCRAAGILICLVGERRDFLRIIGSWMFIAVLYLATISLVPALNPVVAVTSQQNEASPLVFTVDPVPLSGHPALASSVYYLAGIALAILAVLFIMRWRRSRRAERSLHG